MKFLLVKCHQPTLFTALQPIVTEPLELEVLAAVIQRHGHTCRLYDSWLEEMPFSQVLEEASPQVLLLSGYITALERMKATAAQARKQLPQLLILAGGVHAALNPADFMVTTIDLVVHGNGVVVLDQLLAMDFQRESWPLTAGIAYQIDNQWHLNPASLITAHHPSTGQDSESPCSEIPPASTLPPLPDRHYFNTYAHRTHYMTQRPVALIQTALGCPYTCDFCYCRHLNDGAYTPFPLERVMDDLLAAKSHLCWIVDDTFLLHRPRVEAFLDRLQQRQINRQFIAYARADFIVNHADLLPRLKAAGFRQLIVGLEAVDQQRLDDYEKRLSPEMNQQAVTLMKRAGMEMACLFMVHPQDRHSDFRRLRRWIRRNRLAPYTLSIYTPMPGLPGYDAVKPLFTTSDPAKWDFLHLVQRPTHMKPWVFYLQVAYTYSLQLFWSSLVRRTLWRAVTRTCRRLLHLPPHQSLQEETP
ncbi:B12-binding domain-containing radical SAM protein [Anoxynatronum sibiricum]|uniref:Radical SAM protein n=1 Tax=Anoxynatronum sibiricum TaxID=210623 RepID=A0ABU9VTK7_9CLOT